MSNEENNNFVPPYMFTKYYYEKLDTEIVKQLSNEEIHRLINDLQEELKKRGEIEINYRIESGYLAKPY